MSSHNAPGQMLGYLFQVSSALNLLLDCDDPSYQVSIEKYDDVAFDDNGDPKQLIQLKHHTSPASLSDSSVDLWRTINSWIDTVATNKGLLDHTDFIILTTAEVPDDSAAAYIRNGDYNKAFYRLCTTAKTSNNMGNAQFYSNFKVTDDGTLQSLIRRIRILTATDGIIGVENCIQKYIQYSCRPEHVDKVVEQIEGWWYKECVRALSSTDPIITTHRQLQAKIFEISRQYGDDNLPIEYLSFDEANEEALSPKDRVFLDQLRLLQFRNKTLTLAIRDYYRASMQRSSWMRQGLIFANELDLYESRLIDSWEHAFADMEEDLQDYGCPTEDEKVQAGKGLYKRVMDQDLRIRSKVDTPYVMKGTYHRLANNLNVGWHVDFFERLQHLVEEKGQRSEKLG